MWDTNDSSELEEEEVLKDRNQIATLVWFSFEDFQESNDHP